MSKELVIASNRHETKLAILEDDQLVEVFFQRANEYSLAGSIHKGRVTRVLPGMQSAFVDLGLERDTFLYVSDFFEENEEFDRVSVSREQSRGERPRGEQSGRGDQEASATEDAPAAAVEADGADAPAGSPAATPAVSSPAPHTSRPERSGDGDGRDRHGRRSRRRRSRGRGFPDSKYASSEQRESREPREPREPRESRYLPEHSRHMRPAETTHPAEAAAPGVGEQSGDFSVLPGESLAKYSHAVVPALDEAEEEEIRSLQESSAAAAEVAADATAEEAEDVAAASVGEVSGETIAEIAAEVEGEVESEPAVEANAETELTADEEPSAEAGIEVDSSAEATLAEAAAADETAVSEAVAGSETTAEIDAVADPAGATRDAQAPADPALPATAQVREQGGRYMHRGSRRMRRRMRGGSQDSRFDERRGDSSPAAPGETPAPRVEQRTVSRPERSAPTPSITDLLKEGQEIIVQIAKEPLGQKGARITSHIALPGRYVVYMPTVEHTGVSRKIASDEERQRLKRILQVHHAGVPGGFIVRTAGEGKSEEDIAADMNFLFNLWLDIRQKAEKRPAPLLLHHHLDIVQRTLRDQFTEEFKAVWVDNEELYESVLRFVQRFHPSLVTRVKLYTRPEPIFDAFNITPELEKALRPKVWLKSGGYIVINQTEALVAIDVNTGKYVGRSNRLEDTIVKTNTEAVKEIVRQVRLRDLGGIIVVDFIDMDERKNRQKVMQALEECMRADRAPYKILQFNDFGLVAITRKRVKQSLERALCMPCPHCEGAGYVKSVQTIVSEILQEAHKIAAAVEGKDVLLRVNPDVAKFLKSSNNRYLEELEDIVRRPVLVRSDPSLHHEKFDLA